MIKALKPGAGIRLMLVTCRATTSLLLSLRDYDPLSLITQQRNSKTQMRAVRNIYSSWLKQGDDQD